MNLQILSPNSAYAIGSDLWVLPKLDQSSWAREIDWLLNYQISLRKNHPSPMISEELKEIISDTIPDLPIDTQQYTDPLMIISSERLPNKETLYISDSDDLQTWVKKTLVNWENLKKPSIRFFLPQNASIKEFEELWPKEHNENSITLVQSLNEHSY